MRYYEKSQLKISEDTLSDPKKIRYSEDFEDTDIVLLKEILTRYETFPIGTTSIPLGGIATPKLLIVRPASDVTVTIDAKDHVLRGGKLSKMWTTFTSLSITAAAATVISVVVAGE